MLQLISIAIFVLSLAGCDKIPFLSKYFPSMKKEEPKTIAGVSPDTGAATSPPSLAPDVLAQVGRWTLTVEEFKSKLTALKEVIPDYNVEDLDSKKLILEELIRQELLVQDAEASGVATRKDITDAIDEFRRTLLVREMASRIAEGTEVTDSEVEDYYHQNKNAFASPAEWHLREIVVPTQEEAKEILIELLKGADFATMAQTRSKSRSASQGGDLGFLSAPKFPQMENAIASLDVGAISSVFKGPDGYYIVKLEEKKGGEIQKFETIKDEIKTGLTLIKQQQKILSYIDELKKKTPVSLNEELLKS